jgi:hypothetical protein
MKFGDELGLANKMPASRTSDELYEREVANGNYAKAAYILRAPRDQVECGILWSSRKSLLNANFIELLCLSYMFLIGYTNFRHKHTPLRFGVLRLQQYNENQLRWRKHIFFLEKKAPLTTKAIGAYITFCLVLKGISTKAA